MSLFRSRRAFGRRSVDLDKVRRTARIAGKVADVAGTAVAFIPAVGPAVNLGLKAAAAGAKAAEKAAEQAEAAKAAGKAQLSKHRLRRSKAATRRAVVKLQKAAEAQGVKLDSTAAADAAQLAAEGEGEAAELTLEQGGSELAPSSGSKVKLGLGLALLAAIGWAVSRRRRAA